MKRIIILLLLLGFFYSPEIGSTEEPAPGPRALFPFKWDLLWTGYYYKSLRTPEGELPPSEDLLAGGTFFNRGDLSIGLPALDLSLRFLATDKRLLPLEEDDGRAGFNPGIGIYHKGSGSRFLHGVQTEYGLPARINNIWLRSVPYMESRSPSSRDLKAEPAAQDKSQTYLYLAPIELLWPGKAPLNVFFSTALDHENNAALGGGFGFAIKDSEFRLEGYYTRKELPARTISAWFSPSPPLPERDFNIYALGFTFNSAFFGFASDWAWSETFAWGRGSYGNFALRLGNRPWRFSISADAAGSRFVDREGRSIGEGFRMAARAERFWVRSGLLRFQGTFRSPGLEESFNRANLSFYYRPSAPSAAARRNETFPVRFTRASVSLNRDARNPGKTSDVLDLLLGYTFGPLSGSFSSSLRGQTNLAYTEAASGSLLFEGGFGFIEDFESHRLSGELAFRPGFFDIRARLGHTTRANREPLWDLSFNVSVRPGSWGRLSLRIASTDFPERWNYTISWRYNVSRQ